MFDLIRYRPVPSKQPPEIAVVLCHGLGSSPEDIQSILPQIDWPQPQTIECILPRAPLRAVTLAQGQKLTAWFDLFELSMDSLEDMVGLHSAVTQLEHLVQTIQQSGIQSNKIFIGGYSQGGALALRYLWQSSTSIGGVFALSAYLPLRHSRPRITPAIDTPVFQSHGINDDILPFRFGEASYKMIKQHGFNVRWLPSKAGHYLDPTVLEGFSHWLHAQCA